MWKLLRPIARGYAADASTVRDHVECIEGEIDVVTLVHEERPTACATDLDVDDLLQPCWMEIIRRSSRRPTLARAQMHMHNIRDGSLHVDAEREHVRLWNVVVSLYDDPKLGATVIYPPAATEATLHLHPPTPVAPLPYPSLPQGRLLRDGRHHAALSPIGVPRGARRASDARPHICRPRRARRELVSGVAVAQKCRRRRPCRSCIARQTPTRAQERATRASSPSACPTRICAPSRPSDASLSSC